MKKLFSFVFVLLLVVPAFCSNPSFQSFNINQFGTNANSVWIASGSKQTNNSFWLSVGVSNGPVTIYEALGVTTDPLDIIGNTNSYQQVFIQNLNSGARASTDMRIGNDNSSNSDTNYIKDDGINSSGFSGYVGSANDVYSYSGLLVPNYWIMATATNGSLKLGAGGGASGYAVETISSNQVTITKPTTFQNGITNALNSPNSLMVTGSGTNDSTLVNPANQLGFVAWNGAAPEWSLPAQTISWVQTWENGSAAGARGFQNINASGGTAQNSTASPAHPLGVQIQATLSSASSYYALSAGNYFNNAYFHGSGSLELCEMDIQTDSATLATGLNHYTIQAGLTDNMKQGGLAKNGAWFQYDQSTNKWQCVVATASTYVTNIPNAAAIAVNTWYKCLVQIDAATNTVFALNGTPVYTNITASATTTTGFQPTLALLSTSGGGTGATTVSCDYVAYYQKLGVAR